MKTWNSWIFKKFVVCVCVCVCVEGIWECGVSLFLRMHLFVCQA